MPSLSAGFAPGPRHCVHVAQVAGPFGVITTYAVTELGDLGNDCCCALTVPVAASVVVATTNATIAGHLIINFPLASRRVWLFVSSLAASFLRLHWLLTQQIVVELLQFLIF